MSTEETVDIIEFDEAGETVKTTAINIWDTPAEDDGGIWIDLVAVGDDGAGSGIHINDALLARLGFVPKDKE